MGTLGNYFNQFSIPFRLRRVSPLGLDHCDNRHFGDFVWANPLDQSERSWPCAPGDSQFLDKRQVEWTSNGGAARERKAQLESHGGVTRLASICLRICGHFSRWFLFSFFFFLFSESITTGRIW